MKTWYCPSWNGDWRLEPAGTGTSLSVEKPTAAELAQLKKLAPAFVERGWLTEEEGKRLARRPLWSKGRKDQVKLAAPLSEVGPVITSILQPGVNILTAVRFRGGAVEAIEANDLAKPSEPSEATKEVAKDPKAEKAATVKRATPCCPDCYVDAVGPATDVLLTFLDPEQHATWSRHRFLVVRGGLTGHRYVLAHRHTPMAAMQGRLCYDLDDRATMHFHDWTVPPEEEVLGAMLILRHREPWLRNEATALGFVAPHQWREKFKNPFGGGMDGVADAIFTRGFGAGVIGGGVHRALRS
jgi:hypothetical protein